MIALTTLENEQLRLRIAPEAGASIVSLALRDGARWIDVMRPTPPEALQSGNSSDMSCFVLVPYSNRIEGARFRFDGREYALRPNTADGHAIHGDVRKRPWETTDVGPTRARLRFESRRFADVNFPFPFRVNLGYEIAATTFCAELELENAGTEPMPAGMGFHPYYRRTLLHPDEKVELQARVTGAYTGTIPTAPAGPITPAQDFTASRALLDADFDTCFAGWDGSATIRWPGSRLRAEISCEAPLRHLILFAPPGEPFFALEPVSNANNGFNLFADGDTDSGVRVLEPGQTMAASFRLHLVRE